MPVYPNPFLTRKTTYPKRNPNLVPWPHKMQSHWPSNVQRQVIYLFIGAHHGQREGLPNSPLDNRGINRRSYWGRHTLCIIWQRRSFSQWRRLPVCCYRFLFEEGGTWAPFGCYLAATSAAFMLAKETGIGVIVEERFQCEAKGEFWHWQGVCFKTPSLAEWL